MFVTIIFVDFAIIVEFRSPSDPPLPIILDLLFFTPNADREATLPVPGRLRRPDRSGIAARWWLHL
jgi:hypothetical protein